MLLLHSVSADAVLVGAPVWLWVPMTAVRTVAGTVATTSVGSNIVLVRYSVGSNLVLEAVPTAAVPTVARAVAPNVASTA